MHEYPVPNQEQEGNLTRQVERLQQVASERGYQVVALIAEQASSLNERRRGMKRLLHLIDQQEIDVVLIVYMEAERKKCGCACQKHSRTV